MRRHFPLQIRSFALAAALLSSALPATVRAEMIEFEKIAGKWCTSVGSYTFTRSALSVRFADGRPSAQLGIEKIIPHEESIEFVWTQSRGNTAFYDFSKDGKSMAQVANTSGDMGPRREFKRC